MKVGVFDSGLGGLTIVHAISNIFKGADIFYIADTAYAPYGQKNENEILQRCTDITKYLIDKYKIDVLVVACNTATSAAIYSLREKFKNLIIIGTEPGLKPAFEVSSNVAVMATTATLKGNKFQDLVFRLKEESSLHEQACPGLVEQIEKGSIKDKKTFLMLKNWLEPMKKKKVDTIVLGCTHYPLVQEIIKEIMGYEIKLIETGTAIAKRLNDLSIKNGHINEGLLNIFVFYTGKINTNMIDMIFKEKKEKIIIRKEII